MFTADDVNRMREGNDVDGLILVLKSEEDPLIKWLAAKSLGDVGNPGDFRVKAALQNCLTGDPMVAAGASTALAQLEQRSMAGRAGQVQRREPTQAKKEEMHQVKRWMVHRKLFLWIGVVILIGVCVEFIWMVQSAVDPSIWNMVPISIGPILGAMLFFFGLTGINRFNKQEITPLIEAVLIQNPDKVQSRIESGDNVKATDAARQTALHWASKYKSVKIVKLLRDAGADVNAKDKNGVTPFQIAQKNTNTGIIEALGGVSTESAAQPQKKQIIKRKVLFWIGILMLPGMCVLSSVMVDLDNPLVSVLFLLSWIVGLIFLVMAFIPKKEPATETPKSTQKGVDKTARQPRTSTESKNSVRSKISSTSNHTNQSTKRVNMPTKFKGIYIMVVDRQPSSVPEPFVAQSLQYLADNNGYFNMLWTQARLESPAFHEGTQQITNHNQNFDTIVSSFRKWLQQEGVVIDEKRWESYFFHNEVPNPTESDWKRYALIYYYVEPSSEWIKEYSSFVVDYTQAAKDGDKASLQQLLGSAVQCSACERIVDPALRLTFKKDGYLTCPYCGQWWTKSQKSE
jgi:hypothetical protein